PSLREHFWPAWIPPRARGPRPRAARSQLRRQRRVDRRPGAKAMKRLLTQRGRRVLVEPIVMSPWIERRLPGFDIILRIVAKIMLPALGAIANCFLTRHFVGKN